MSAITGLAAALNWSSDPLWESYYHTERWRLQGTQAGAKGQNINSLALTLPKVVGIQQCMFYMEVKCKAGTLKHSRGDQVSWPFHSAAYFNNCVIRKIINTVINPIICSLKSRITKCNVSAETQKQEPIVKFYVPPVKFFFFFGGGKYLFSLKEKKLMQEVGVLQKIFCISGERWVFSPFRVNKLH